MPYMPDELLWTDRDGDQPYAKRTGPDDQCVLYIQPGEGEIYLPEAAIDALRDALKAGEQS